jgi:hypothetical protein
MIDRGEIIVRHAERVISSRVERRSTTDIIASEFNHFSYPSTPLGMTLRDVEGINI